MGEYRGEIVIDWRLRRYPAPQRRELEKFLRRAVVASGLPLDPGWGLELTFVGDRAMVRCNQQYVGHEGTTDVITFSYFDSPEPLFPGDVGVQAIVNPDAAFRVGGAENYGAELALYIVHALLHAAGEDDLEDEPRAKMRRREREVLDPLAAEFDFSKIFPLGSRRA